MSNKKVILKRFVTGFPTEDDMELVTGTVRLAVPDGSPAVVVKNLYVSCDPYMRNRMSEHNDAAYIEQFVPGEVYQPAEKKYSLISSSLHAVGFSEFSLPH